MYRIVLLVCSIVICGAQQRAVTPLQKAVEAYQKGELGNAIEILDKQIALGPEKSDYYYLRGDIYSTQGQREKALEDYSQGIKLSPDNPAGYFRRASEHFRVGKARESVADFEKVAELYPQRAAHLWQLGIAYYYANEFEKSRKLFESHQQVNQQDVENAVWHFLGVAKLEDFDKAREKLIPISEDLRVPMTQIHAVFAGSAKPDDVIAAARVGEPNTEQLKQRLFYAHLYLGLFEEARGNSKASLEHMSKAANEYSQKHYMGDVARTHLKLRSN